MKLRDWNIEITENQEKNFSDYFDLLVEWNNKMNLTTITEEKEVYIKHFIDSISLCNYIPKEELNNKKIIDVGTGAGFPGIPLAIYLPNCEVVLMDSLNKRVEFLKVVIKKLGLLNVQVIHSRAEDLGKDTNYREHFDFCVSRAVANLSVLMEYCTPFVKVNGLFVSYKSVKAKEEIEDANHAFKELKCKLEKEEKFTLPDINSERVMLFIKKVGTTKSIYPRKSGTPSKKPL